MKNVVTSRWIYSAVILVLLALALGCGDKGTDSQEKQPPPYTLADNTTIIPQDGTTVIMSYDTAGTITFDESSTYAQEVSVGDVIIGQDDEKAPSGLLRKVTSKTTQNGSIVLETKQAKLTDAFETLNISETFQLRPSDIRGSKTLPGSKLKASEDDETFVVDLDRVLYDQDGDHRTTDDQIRLEGECAFTAELFIEIKEEWFQIKKFETSLSTEADVNIDVIANVKWKFDEPMEFQLWKQPLAPIPVVPPVVWLVPTLTVKAYVHGDMTVTFETGIIYTEEKRIGFRYENDDFYDIGSKKKHFELTPPQFSAECDFETGLSVNAACLLYGLAGPYFAGKTGFHFESDLSADPCNVELTCDLEAIAYAVVGIECDVLDFDYNKEYRVYTHHFDPWVVPLGGSGTVIIDPEPDSINAPWSVVGPCSYGTSGNGDKTLNGLTPGDYSVTWGTVSGWITPSNETQTLAEDETVTFDGIYVGVGGSDTIVIDPSPDSLNAPWSLEGPNSYSTTGNGDHTLTGLTPGEYTVTWGDVSGWITPVSETQTLPADILLTFSAVYAEAGHQDSTGTVTDVDLNVYRTVKIGDQWWMAENLKVTRYRNGDAIDNVTDDGWWNTLSYGAYCDYDNDAGNVDTYGRLYNYFAVRDPRGLAPDGWQVPTDVEWQILVGYLGGDQLAGGTMKTMGTSHWLSPNTGATNESGFSALPGGSRYGNGYFARVGRSASFWSSTEPSSYGSYGAWLRDLDYDDAGVDCYYLYMIDGLSVRCVKGEGIGVPEVTTASVSGITQTTAECGGTVTSGGGATVTAHGVCWSTDATPTLADSKTTDGAGISSFTSSITDLTARTTYYVRAYATNSAGAGYGSTVPFTTEGSSSGLFAPQVTYAAGDHPVSAFSIDLNGDGDNDLAVANRYSDNVSILLNNGNMTFQPAVNYATGDGPYSVFSIDLDGDGDNDLMTANSESDKVSILMNNGVGIFQTAVSYDVGVWPVPVFSIDLDGDGDNDLATANVYSDNVSILFNNGDGTFLTAVNYEVGENPWSVFSIDLDGDGDNDLMTANFYSDNVSILMNNGVGIFQAAVSYDVGNWPWSVFSIDLDGDGDNDIATVNHNSHDVSILLNDGDGTFQTAVNYGVGDSPRSVFSIDLDGDGDNDLATANCQSDNVSILLNGGDGTFPTAVNYDVGEYPWSVFSIDLDGDGDNDLMTANSYSNNVSILMNTSR